MAIPQAREYLTPAMQAGSLARLPMIRPALTPLAWVTRLIRALTPLESGDMATLLVQVDLAPVMVLLERPEVILPARTRHIWATRLIRASTHPQSVDMATLLVQEDLKPAMVSRVRV